MSYVSGSYPMKMFIRHKAKEHLNGDVELRSLREPLDDGLFQELTSNLFRSEVAQALERPQRTREKAEQIEDRLALEIAERYKQIKLRQLSPLVQRLNSLL